MWRAGLVALLAVSVLGDCGDLESCLKTELAGVLGRAARAADLELVPGLKLVSSGLETKDEVPRTVSNNDLDSLIADRAAAFFRTHSLQLRLTDLFGLQQQEEGRGKRKRGTHTLLMLMFMMASMMLPLKMGTLAMLAGKALIISKLALALAAIVGLKKLLSGDDHQDSYQVVQVPAHGHRKRSTDYLDLPYRGHSPPS